MEDWSRNLILWVLFVPGQTLGGGPGPHWELEFMRHTAQDAEESGLILGFDENQRLA